MEIDRLYHYIKNKNEEKPYARFYFVNEHAVRITFARNFTFTEPRFSQDVLLPHAEVRNNFRLLKMNKTYELTDVQYKGLGVAFDRGRNTVAVTQGYDDVLQFNVSPDARSPKMVIDTRPGEGFYGFGEWFNGFRREKGTLDLYNLESPAFTQHKHTYSAFPCFLSDRGYMVLVLNAHRGKAYINKPPGKLKLKFNGGILDMLVINAPSWKKILEEYTALSGRPPMVPLWSFGLWNTSYPVENQEETLQRVEEHRKRNFPLDAVIFDYHWENGFHDFRWRKPLFPEPEEMTASMAGRGVKTGLIYTPYINGRGIPLYKLLVRLYVKNAPRGVPFLSEDHAGRMYEEGMRNNYFAHPRVTWWLGRGGAVDFTNDAAVNWWFERQKALMDQGVYFFKNDGGEYLPEGSLSSIGLDKKEFHNIYGFYYARAVFSKSQDYHGRRRAMVFSRTTWAGTQRYPGIFLGDQTPEYRHIAATMRCGLNMSLLGFAYWGADVLGLYRKPSPELHRRYSQWALFSPIARYFSAPGDDSRNPWGISDECGENFLRHLNLRMKLLPYFYRLAREAYEYGVPILRPLCLEFEKDKDTFSISDQAMIGEALMIAPATGVHRKGRKVYFPSGDWYDWWTGAQYSGPGWRNVYIGDNRVPLFAAGGRPVVLGPMMQYIPEGHRFTDLEVHLFPPFDGSTYIYEDDGATIDYQDGIFSTQGISIKNDKDTSSILITFDPCTEKFSEQPRIRRLEIVLHNFITVKGITLNGMTLGNTTADNNYFTVQDNTLSIKCMVRTAFANRWVIEY